MAEENKQKARSKFRSAQDFIKKGRTSRAVTATAKVIKSGNKFLAR